MDRYILFIIDGPFVDIQELGMDSIRFEGLTEDELLMMAKVALVRGMDIVIRKAEEE